VLAKSPRSFMVRLLFWGFLLGVIFGFFIGLRVGKVSEEDIKRWSNKPDESPIRSIIITVDPFYKENLFAQLRKFSSAWGYAIRIAPDSIYNETFTIQLWRLDMKLIGQYSTATGTLRFGFYNTDPAKRMPWWFFDSELGDLKKLMSLVPSSTFSVDY
jgi:hypothetical protein